MDEQCRITESTVLVELAAEIVSAYVSNNKVQTTSCRSSLAKYSLRSPGPGVKRHRQREAETGGIRRSR